MAMLTKAKKIELSKKLSKEIIGCDLIFVSFSGIGFEKIQSLREKLREVNSNFKILRNSVIYFAMRESSLLKDVQKKPHFLKGPTAVIFVKNQDEISTVCRILMDFIKENPTLRVKGGLISKEEVTPDLIKEISKIGSKKDIVFRIASSLYTPMLNLRSVVEAPIRDLIYVLESLKNKMEGKN